MDTMGLDTLIAFAVGWGLGIGFAFKLGSILWPEQQNVWDKHKEVQQRAQQMVRRKG